MLRRWSADSVNVLAHRRLVSHENVPHWELRSIKGLAQQTDLYTTVVDGDDEDQFEKFITREFDQPGAEAVEHLVARRQMKPRQWRQIALKSGSGRAFVRAHFL